MPIGVARHNFITPRDVSAENAKTTAWVAAVVAAGGTVSTARRTLVNNLFNSLDSNGLTSLLNRLWLLAAANTTAASIDLIALQTYTLVNSPTFTVDRGYAGNGTSSYLNLNTANCGTQDSAMYGFALRTNQGIEGTTSMGHSNGSTVGGSVNPLWSDGNTYWSCNDAEGFAGIAGVANRIGIWIVTRTASTTCICYKDGSSIGNNGQTSTGVANSANFFLGADSNAGTPTLFTANQFSASFIGNSGLNATQAANLNTIIQTYMTAVGA